MIFPVIALHLNLNKITDSTRQSCTKNVKILIPLKYLSNFSRILEIQLINLILTSAKCVISNAAANQATAFSVIDTKRYVPVVTLSTENNEKLLQQLKSGFKRKTNWNKYQSKISTQARNRYLDYLIDPSFQGVNRLFVLTFDVNTNRLGYSGCYLPTIKIEHYSFIIDRKRLF